MCGLPEAALVTYSDREIERGGRGGGLKGSVFQSAPLGVKQGVEWILGLLAVSRSEERRVGKEC